MSNKKLDLKSKIEQESLEHRLKYIKLKVKSLDIKTDSQKIIRISEILSLY